MSLENHPNFHALKFVTDVVSTLYEHKGKKDIILEDILTSFPTCIRGRGMDVAIPDISDITRDWLGDYKEPTREQIVEYVGTVENMVDRAVAKSFTRQRV